MNASRISSTAIAIALQFCCSLVLAEESIYDHFDFIASDQFAYDDNVFRLPTVVSTQLVGANARRDDDVNQLAVGIDSQWSVSKQTVSLTLLLGDNHYLHNHFLDNVGGNGKAAWDWAVGHRATGEVSVQYNRTLADFADTQLYGKDLVNLITYVGSGNFRIGPRWSLTAEGRHSRTTESAPQREFDDNTVNSGRFGVEYSTLGSYLDANDSVEAPIIDRNSIGLDYRYARAKYAHPEALNGVLFLSDYFEGLTRLHARYFPTARLKLEGDFGYLHRSYLDHAIANFSGDVWHASAQWNVTEKSSVVATGWRELRAFIDAESNYFVGKGFSVAPTWNATERLSLAIKERWEKQDYTGSNIATLFIPRHDTLQNASATLTYTPRKPLQVTAAYRLEHRSSNQTSISYGDDLVSAAVQLTW